jgi:excinuclease ABC subunit C
MTRLSMLASERTSKKDISILQKNHEYGRPRVLVKKIRIKHIVVQWESDALLLENNLIKSIDHGTMYCSIKDDKSYPLYVLEERFPGIF